MTEREAKIAWLEGELLRYCGPIFVAPTHNTYPGEMIGNGTYALIDTGEKRLLVTCAHVWDEYVRQHDANKETILAVAMGQGDSCIAFKSPESHSIQVDRDLDLLILEFEPQWVSVPHNKSWFKVSDWPIPEAKKGQPIVTLGFPRVWRKTSETTCKFGSAAIPLVVTDTTDRTIAAFSNEENQEVLIELKDSLGGMSGSPAYQFTENGELQLVGFAKMGPEESHAPNRKCQTEPGSFLQGVLFTHASFLQKNGTLRM